MGSPPKDQVLLNGVAAIVHALTEFAPVNDLFHHYLQRWRKKYCLFEKQREKVKTQLAEFWRDEPQTPDPDQEYWPARRIFSPDRTRSEVLPIPQKLDLKLRRYEGPIRRHSLRTLHEKANFTLAESFILLAELHDAAYAQLKLGNDKEFIVGVAEATEILAIGLSQAAVVNLTAIVQRVLDRIEALPDSRSRNKLGKTLQEIIQRSRETLDDLVIRSRPQQPTAAKTPSDETLVSADQLGEFAGVGGKVIRVALSKAGCNPSIESTGKGNPHQWRYCDAIQSLKAVKSGKLRSCKWPDSAAEIMPKKDSSKIPAKK